MRRLPALAILLVSAVPAFAQNSDRSSAAEKAPAAQMASGSAAAQQKLRDALQKAGFKDIQIVEPAFMVRAQTPDGGEVVMYVNSPSSDKPATGASTETAPAPRAPVVDRANANIDRYKAPDEKAKPDPYKQPRSDPNKTR